MCVHLSNFLKNLTVLLICWLLLEGEGNGLNHNRFQVKIWRIVSHSFLEKAALGPLVSWEGLVASRLVDKISDGKCWSLAGLRYIGLAQRALARGRWVGWHACHCPHVDLDSGAAEIISALRIPVQQFPLLQLWDVGEFSILSKYLKEQSGAYLFKSVINFSFNSSHPKSKVLAVKSLKTSFSKSLL